MLATGTDAVAGQQDWNGIRYADDTLMLCVQGATHWDALGHVFYQDKAYNGHDAKLMTSRGPERARHRAFQEQDGRARRAARHRAPPQGPVAQGRREHLQRRTQHLRARPERRNPQGRLRASCAPARWSAASRRRRWGGYAGGDAPGVKFENCYWCQEKQLAAICTDTWGVEVRPNETTEANQPWHWVVIPAMGLWMGEIFYLKALAEDCESRRRLRILLLRAAADHHRRHRLADQSAGDQVAALCHPGRAKGAAWELEPHFA